MIQLKLGHREQARAFLGRSLTINPHFSILWAPVAKATIAKLGGGR